MAYYRKKRRQFGPNLAHSGPRTVLTLDGLCYSAKVEGLLARCSVRGGWTAGAISLKLKVFFAKSRLLARSRPSIRPIGRPRLARDVATLVGPLIGQKS
jgi:hypothetical protein